LVNESADLASEMNLASYNLSTRNANLADKARWRKHEAKGRCDAGDGSNRWRQTQRLSLARGGWKSTDVSEIVCERRWSVSLAEERVELPARRLLRFEPRGAPAPEGVRSQSCRAGDTPVAVPGVRGRMRTEAHGEMIVDGRGRAGQHDSENRQEGAVLRAIQGVRPIPPPIGLDSSASRRPSGKASSRRRATRERTGRSASTARGHRRG